MRNLYLLRKYKIKTKIRKRIKEQSKLLRLTVYKSNKHIYAQIFNYDVTKVIVSASSLDKEFLLKYEKIKTSDKASDKTFNKINIARLVGFLLADRSKKKGITQVVFDRSGFKFHGRIKAVADSMLENNIKC